MRGTVTRDCAECGARVQMSRDESRQRRYVYCSEGCQANGWRRSYRLPVVPAWTGRNPDLSPRQLMAVHPQA